MGRDGYTGLAVLAASLALFWGTLGLERHPMVPIGPAFYPRIVLGIAALMALALVAMDLRSRRRRPAAASPSHAARYGLVVAAFCVFGLYVIALPFLGFRVATFAFMAAMQATLDPPRGLRRWIVLLAVAAATSLVVHYAFDEYLKVLLPRGLWTGF